MSDETCRDDGGRLDRRRFLKTVTAGAAGLALSGAAANDAGARDEDPEGGMKRRPLGSTGIEASVIAYGCGRLQGEHLPMLQAAFERGINLFDVAWSYQKGQAEVALGRFLETLADRGKVYVVTKASNFTPPKGSSKAVYEALRKEMTASLKRLQTDYVDFLYYPHGATSPDQFKDAAMIEALARLKEEKLVRHLGASTHTNYTAVAQAAIEKSYCDVIMPVANICTQNPDRPDGVEDTRGVLQAAGRKKIGLVAMKVANPAYLTDRTDTLLAKAFPKESTLSRHQKLYTYMLGQDGVSCVVVGMRTVTHLREAIQVGTA